MTVGGVEVAREEAAAKEEAGMAVGRVEVARELDIGWVAAVRETAAGA